MSGNIILSTEIMVQQFLEAASRCTVANYSLENLIADAISTIEYAEGFEQTLQVRCDKLYLSQVDETQDDPSAKLITTAWHRLVCNLNLLIEQQDLRNIHGRFDHYFVKMLGYDVVVCRYED